MKFLMGGTKTSQIQFFSQNRRQIKIFEKKLLYFQYFTKGRHFKFFKKGAIFKFSKKGAIFKFLKKA